ncbi:hypothetical protein G7Y89_g15765 [Cudoniella acicularis]|uniref:Uncharacterized protein n=1 Tax=Cudoniella acicularis TaxID=354080 RepID=A0A8H4QGL8_9HELO|nr:hypothetical protein G7Y89_g15765 [Cudoniella acicularis]
MATPTIAPFSKVVIEAVKKLFPEELADKSFDNTGLLLEAPYRPGHLEKSALITVDLTKAVADEAIARRDCIIIAYHPIIFRPLKSITLSNTQQSTLLRLAQEGISVYSPHTAVDAALGGLNDWLADGISSPGQAIRSVITPITNPPVGYEGTGYGRIVRFNAPQKLGDLVAKISAQLGPLSGVSVATPQSVPSGEKSKMEIFSVGICAGSGGSMLAGLDVDLLFTGELSHHEALAATEKGKCVITTFHSNSERAYFRKMMQPMLVKTVKVNILDMARRGEWTEPPENGFDIAVSEVDCDPFEIITGDLESW